MYFSLSIKVKTNLIKSLKDVFNHVNPYRLESGLRLQVSQVCKRVHERGCLIVTYLVLKSTLHLQSEDTLSGLHNFKGPVEVYDLVLRLRLGLG